MEDKEIKIRVESKGFLVEGLPDNYTVDVKHIDTDIYTIEIKKDGEN